jgi:MFS family permease
MSLWKSALTPRVFRRVVALSYLQAMVGSIFGASTGGMFLTGYALKLGATKPQIGLLTTIPMWCVGVQLISSMVVEGGASRRRLTFIGSLLNVSAWLLIILLPYAIGGAATDVRIGVLIAIVTFAAAFGQFAGNVRGGWVGDLVPSAFRGTFFGRMALFGGIIGMVFAVLEGTFLDFVKGMGLEAFSWLFAFGMIFGLINAFLFIPQPDVAMERHVHGADFWKLLRSTLGNRRLLGVMAFGMMWFGQMIAWPFYVVYMLQDLQMPYLGVGLVNAAQISFILLSSPFWGRVVNRYGCKPVLIVCSITFVAWTLAWMPMTSARMVYMFVIPMHFFCGMAAGGVNVGLNTLLYKSTTSAGRSMQLAVYAIVVAAFSSPMPTLGGYLPGLMAWLGYAVDLRFVFAVSVLFTLGATTAACFLREDGAASVRDLLRNLPGHVRHPSTLR